MKRLLLIVLLATLSGCTTRPGIKDAIESSAVARQAAEAAKGASSSETPRTCVGGIDDGNWWVSCQ